MRTEREKTLAGELYNALDPELVKSETWRETYATRSTLHARRMKRFASSCVGNSLETAGIPFGCSHLSGCDYGSNIEPGERVYFNFNCIVLDVCRVMVGDYSFFGPAVQILTSLHPMEAEPRRKQEYENPIEIRSDVWVDLGALILAGGRIGSRSVIGAGSLGTFRTKSLPRGNPCRAIRELTQAATADSERHRRESR